MVSMLLDNVTTILLITPVVIKLFECLNLNPVPVLPFIIFNINIGGLATLIGHPPNLLITENTYVHQHDVNFVTFAMHMSVGVILTLIQTNIHVRLQCRNIPQMVKCNSNVDSEIEIWKTCLKNIGEFESDKSEEMNNLQMILKRKIAILKEIDEKTKKKGLIHRNYDSKTFLASFEQLRNSVNCFSFHILCLFVIFCFNIFISNSIQLPIGNYSEKVLLF